MEKFTRQTITTVGELKKLLEQFPDDKPIICDSEGNTWSPEFYNWAESDNNDLDWPIAIDCGPDKE